MSEILTILTDLLVKNLPSCQKITAITIYVLDFFVKSLSNSNEGFLNVSAICIDAIDTELLDKQKVKHSAMSLKNSF